MKSAPAEFDAKPSLLAYALCVLLASVTFPLIWVGGLVTTYDAGMAVPDWPGTYGYNMFLYPWQTWFYGPWDLFIEHGHRLLGALAGMIAIGLVAASLVGHSPQWLRVASIAALVLVIMQGALGGARVLLDERVVAAVHGCVGPGFFAYVCTLAFWIRQSRIEAATRESAVHVKSRGTVVMNLTPELVAAMKSPSATDRSEVKKLLTIVLPLAVAVALQMIVGAMVRHVPVTATAGYFKSAVLIHVVLGLVIAIQSLAIVWKLRSLAVARAFRGIATLIAAVVIVQISLGVATYVVKYAFPTILVDEAAFSSLGLSTERAVAGFTVIEKGFVQAMITTAHVANGSLLLAGVTLLASRVLVQSFSGSHLMSTKTHLPLHQGASA